jgi:hypothetical protein
MTLCAKKICKAFPSEDLASYIVDISRDISGRYNGRASGPLLERYYKQSETAPKASGSPSPAHTRRLKYEHTEAKAKKLKSLAPSTLELGMLIHISVIVW